MPDVLEVLYAARASISDEEFVFAHWTTCTCGHIYRATLESKGVAVSRQFPNGRPLGAEISYPSDSDYLQVLEAIIRTVDAGGTSISAPFTVSDATLALARRRGHRGSEHVPGDRALRSAALILIDNTIEAIEEENEQTRLALLKEMAKLDPKEEPLALVT